MLEDWEQWSSWTEETTGFWIRRRNCKNPGVTGKCRGSTLQRKTKKIQYQYQIEVDKSNAQKQQQDSSTYPNHNCL